MNHKLKTVWSIVTFCSIFGLISCLSGNDSNSTDYSDWRDENTKYIQDAETETLDGKLRYEKIVPVWDQSVYTLVEWHTKNTADELTPISNSTVDVKYVLRDIKGDTLDSSSYFRCHPSDLVTGFWVALTSMVPGDSVTAIMPYNAGYGQYSYGSVLPYSTLIFDIKLDSIVAYQSQPWRQ